MTKRYKHNKNMDKKFQTVDCSDRLPSFAGWYFIVGDCMPECLGRSWFDGKKFALSEIMTRDVDNIFWLEEQH